jgi:hypothetical protein
MGHGDQIKTHRRIGCPKSQHNESDTNDKECMTLPNWQGISAIIRTLLLYYTLAAYPCNPFFEEPNTHGTIPQHLYQLSDKRWTTGQAMAINTPQRQSRYDVLFCIQLTNHNKIGNKNH